jgi:hypothetical protein
MDDRSQHDAAALSPLDRLARAVLVWDDVPHARAADRDGSVEHDATTVERAKGAVMLRYGVNSHVALAMLAGWARDAGVSITEVARALVDGAVRSGRLPHHHHQVGEWLRARNLDIN